MQKLLFMCMFVFAFACAPVKNLIAQQNNLNGSWVAVSQEMGGNALPESAVENQKLIIDDSNYTVIAESVDKGILKYKDDRIDIYGKEGVNAGKHFTAIYKYENSVLTVCYNLTGKDYPKAFESKSNPMYFLAVFKKEPGK